MSLAKIDRNFTFVGSASELRSIFKADDLKVGDSALILVVPEGASFQERQTMAVRAAEIRKAEKS